MTTELLRAVADRVRDQYVFADVGAEAAHALLDRQDRFDGLAGDALAGALTATLQEVARDLHLQVRHSAEPREPSTTSQWDDPEFMAAYWSEQDAHNQGFSRVERLAGNIGLLVVHSLDEPEGTGPVVEAALGFLARCDAIVLDVRESNGGAPSGVAFLTSHFVDAPSKKLVDVIARDGTVVEQSWTTGFVRAARFPWQPLFVLTSAATPSGTEELAYGLQGLGRARVVGERTAGAANPVDVLVVDPHYLLRLPTVRVVHAATGSNWEGVGVQPDLPCATGDALGVAHREAARTLLADPRWTCRSEAVRAELVALAEG